MKAKIKKITKENKRQDVYDLTVRDNHNFFANNTLLHNSEQWLDAHNVCLLSSVNLAKYREYGAEKYPRMVYLMTHLLDAFRRYEIEERRSPSDLQMEKLKKLPRIGLGVTGLADYFIDQKIAYASQEAIDDVHNVFGTLAAESYKASYDIAKRDGFSFEYYDKEKYKQSPFVQNLLDKGLIEDYHLDMQAHVCKTTVAPNGCIVSSTRVKTENGVFSIKDLFAQQGVNIDEEFDPGTIFDLKEPLSVETTEGLRKINKLYINGQTETIKVSTKNGKEIEGTFNHKVLVKLDEWKPLEDLKLGDVILIKNGSNFEEDQVESIVVGQEKTYDIEVDDNHHYLLENGIVSHNTLTEIVEAGGGGVEPIFAKYFVRRERSTTNDWKEWFTYNHAVRRVMGDNGLELEKENVDSVTSEPWWVTAHTVNNKDKIDMMSAIQQYIDSAISITYNLPKDADPKDIEDIYWYAWEKEIKNVSVFREGSKMGVLITDANYEETKNDGLKSKTKDNRFSVKRPEYVECDMYEIKVNKEPHVVIVGLVEGRPYEVFVTNNKDGEIDLQSYKKGVIYKKKKGHYNLIVENGETKTIVDDITKKFDTDYGTLGRFISMSLRHEVPVEFVVDQLAKDKNFLGFEKSVGRILKKYIKEDEVVKTSDVCPECGSSLVYKEGCKTCTGDNLSEGQACAWSKCD